MFNCETCEFKQMVDGLDADNAEAWRCYAKLTAHRWIWDMDAGPWWLGQVFAGCDDDERDELMGRVSVIYDTLHPPKASRHGA